MKKYIVIALLAFVCISCDKLLDDTLSDKLIIPSDLSAYTPEFDSKTPESKSGALVEYQPESWHNSETISTRTYAVMDPQHSSEYIQYWSTNDEISVFFTTANLKYRLTDLVDEDRDGTEERDYGHFQLIGDAVTGTPLSTSYYYSIYPYKEQTSINYESGEVTYNFSRNQHYIEDSYSNGENGMIAREALTDDGVLYFQNFCSYLQLRLIANEGQTKTVKQITLTTNDPENRLAGEASIKYNGEEPVVSMKMTATNQLILNCENGVTLSQDSDNPTKFWFVLPGGFTFTEGFRVTVTFTDGTYMEKSTSKFIQIARSHIKPMAIFKTDDDEDDDIILNGPIRYKYEDTSIDEPYPLSNTFYGVDGTQLQIIDQVYDEENEEWVVILSDKLKTIGGNSFEEFEPDLEYIKIDNNDESPIVVNDFAFYNCTAESIIIYNDVEAIKESSFENATTTSLYIDGNVSTLCTNVGSGSYLEDIKITGDVTIIEDFAFSSCMDLTTFNCNSIESIGYRAFYQCRSLSDIDLSTVIYISDGAFRGCTSLLEVNLNSVITIGDNAFMGCSKLTKAVISSNCTMIGEGAFCNATRLQQVTCYAIFPPFIKTDNTDGCYVFDKAHKNLVIYIPNGSLSYYTDPNYFVNNPSGYNSPVQATVNWWYQEYTYNLKTLANKL